MNIGTKFRARVAKNVFGGDGISRVAGVVVFTPGVIAGEDFIGEVTHVNKDYVRAKVVEITKPSPERILPECSGSGRCPGCVYGHMSHSFEQVQKLNQLRDFLKPLGVSADQVQGSGLESAPESFYRNKIRLTMRKAGGEAQLGYVFPDGKMYELAQCRLASANINCKLRELLADPGFIPSMHDRMTITLRESADGVSCWRNNASKRMGMLHEKVLGKTFVVPAEGFFQVNNHGMSVLVNLLQDALRDLECQCFIDAYAGSGLFGSVAAAAGVKVIRGVESDVLAAEAAQQNYRNFGAESVEFYSGDAAVLLPELLNNAPENSVVVFDPPRGGMEGRAIRTVVGSRIRNVIYISCHPATLVRDLGRLQQGGFKIISARMIHMFPRSSHFETFVQMTR
ncbi:MAG: class I SAM-dependent RNA methyltransferase [Lentisphaerae bacterium]|nr:class I SAM-dependent RNA methyltransferase [Lentisphaerota bacterium]